MNIQINALNWTQEQKNMTKAMVSVLLKNANITFTDMSVTGHAGDNLYITINNPSSDPSSVITAANIASEFSSWKASSDAATTAYNNEENRRAQLAATVDIKGYQIDTILNAIDNISSLAELKTFLKKLVILMATKRITD